MCEEDVDEVVESGERLPTEMWEPGMSDTVMKSPVFDGEKIIDQGG